MLVRSILAWAAFAALLFGIAFSTQGDDEFDLQFVVWSALLSLPIAISTYMGALSNPERTAFQYPALSISVLGAWILGVGPSLVIDAPESHIAFNFTDLGLAWARALFLLWCVVFVLVSGRPYERRMQVEVGGIDFGSLAGWSVAIIAYLIPLGLYSNYQGGGAAVVETGSLAAVCKIVGEPVGIMAPALCLVAWVKTPTPAVRTMAAIGLIAAAMAILLSASRTAVVMALVTSLLVSRKLGLQFHLAIMGTLLAALPAIFVLIVAYRGTLKESHEAATSVGAYLETAASTSGEVAQDDSRRSNAVSQLTTNLRARLWYGQQFSATVDEWLDNGAGYKGTLLANVIRSAPSWLYPGKNELASRFDIEPALIATGRFPQADLSPMPWQQWLFEFGAPGIFFGAFLYGRLARLIERRLSNTRSVYEVAFWLGLLVAICSPENMTDTIVLTARSIAAFLIVAGGAAFLARLVLRQSNEAKASQPALQRSTER